MCDGGEYFYDQDVPNYDGPSTDDDRELPVFEEAEEEEEVERRPPRKLVSYEDLLFDVLKEQFTLAKMEKKVPLYCSKTLGLEMKIETKHNYAVFTCARCEHEWSTHKTLVDFTCTYHHPRGGRVKVQKVWGQGCNQCEEEVSPLFCTSAASESAVWNTAAQITREILRRFYGDDTWSAPAVPMGGGRGQKPHDRARCEACRAGVCSMANTFSVHATRRTPPQPRHPPPVDAVRRPICWYMSVAGVDKALVDTKRTPATPTRIAENPYYDWGAHPPRF
ncbi:hypothetical protein DIPPA_34130 [Diplonema papillatum]|nr:hypothetical protein DIPPA_34130 [Diplonema papillatum]|eukprot:gene12618-19539_t